MKFNIKQETEYFRKRIAKDVTCFGTWEFIALVFFVMLPFNQSFALRYLLAVFVCVSVELLIKIFYKKNRPDIKKFKAVSWYQNFEEHRTFPSGHSGKIAVLATMVHLQYSDVYLSSVFGAVALLVAWSRVELERHYVKDVVAGLIVGILTAVILNNIF